MVTFLKKFLGQEDSPYKSKIYMAQPSILYHTQTERTCRSYLKSHFEADEIHTPLDFRKKDPTFFEQLMSESVAVVGITIEDLYTYPVWQDLDRAESLGRPFFTLQVTKKPGGKDLDFFLIEGMAEFEKLSWEQTKSLYMEIQRKQIGVPLIFGRTSEY